MGTSSQQAIKSIQRGVIAMGTSDTSKTATVVAVNTAKSELSFNGQSRFSAAYTAYLSLTNATTVTAARSSTGESQNIAWQLVEWY